MIGSDCVAKVKMGVVNLKGKESIIPSKATKARKRYVNIVDIDGAMLTCELQSVKLWWGRYLKLGYGLTFVWDGFVFFSVS